jgi:signal transduction histidine kinase/ligand-binding sensor domain-containing protein
MLPAASRYTEAAMLRVISLPELIRTLALGLLLAGAVFPAPGPRWHASAMRQLKPQPAQPLDDMAHMSWTRRDGAPNDIAALAQTPDGYLWIGSRLGLYRFDGLQFSPYPFTTADPRLPSSDISALAADPNGGLWIGYRMGGISYLNGSTKIDYDQRSGLVSESTEQLVCLSDGSVWATADGRLMHLAGQTWENYSAVHGLSSQGLFSLFFDRDRTLWTAEKGHVFKLPRGSAKFAEVDLPSHQINQLVQLPDGAIWASDAWINIRPLSDAKGTKAIRIPGVPVVLADDAGSIWLAHDFGGLTRVKSPGTPGQIIEDYKTSDGLTDGQTRAILQDHDGAIWVGTARGLDRFQHSPLVNFRAVRLDYFPALLAGQNGGIWLNDMDKPLMRLQAGHLSSIGEPHGSSSLFQDAGGGVWLLDAISHDFYRYTDDGKPPLRIPAPAIARDVETWCIGEDTRGALLASFEGHGLWRYSGQWEPVNTSGLPQEAPISLTRSASGRVWLGYAHNQIALEDARGYHMRGRAQGLDVNAVLTIYDVDGLVVVGGSDGLSYYDGQRFHPLLLRTQNLMRGISGIVKDHSGDLWLNAAAGVIRLPAAEWKAAQKNERYAMDFQILNERDGLIGTPAQNKPKPSAVADVNGILWFATSGHLVSINPTSIPQKRAPPKVLLQSVSVNGSVVAPANGAPITLDARRIKNVEFDYIGVDLSAPDRVTYQYMLEGLDTDWQDAGARRQANYTYLPHGSYHFRVRAASGTGTWNELPSAFAVTVTPAFYQTTWFYGIGALSLGGLLWLAYRLRFQYLSSQLQERMETRARERLSIARDLHDTLLQGVHGLILRFHFATEQIQSDEAAKEMLRAALTCADQVINEGREKVRELRDERASSNDLAEHLEHIVSAPRTEGGPRINLRVEGEPRLLSTLVEDEIGSIARESLNNALRHAGAREIELKLAFEPTQLRFCCSDDGCGISPAILQASRKQGHWGIVGMRERAARIGAKLEFASAQGAGTQVVVSIPAKQAYAVVAAASSERFFTRVSLFPRAR